MNGNKAVPPTPDSKIPFGRSIITRLIAVVVYVVLLVGAVGLLAKYTSQGIIRDTIGQESVVLAAEIMERINRYLYSRFEVFHEYSRDLILAEALEHSNKSWIQGKTSDPAEIREIGELMEELKEKVAFYDNKYPFRIYSNVIVLNKFGGEVAVLDTNAFRPRGSEYLFDSNVNDNFYVWDISRDNYYKENVLPVRIPVVGEDGDLAGAIVVCLNMACINDELKKDEHFKSSIMPEISKFDQLLDFKLIDNKGNILYASDASRSPEIFPQQLVDRFSSQGNLHGYFIDDGDLQSEGQELFSYARSECSGMLGELGWILVVEQETDKLFTPLNDLSDKILIIVLIAIGMVAVLGIILTKTLSVPIRKLILATTEVGRGNLDVSIDIGSRDEIGVLAAYFRNMIDELKRTTTSIDYLEAEIEERKMLEKALVASESRLKHFVSASPVIIYSCSHPGDHAFNFLSENIKSQLGYENAEVMEDANFWRDKVHPEDYDTVAKVISELTYEGSRILEYRFLDKNGEYRWLRDGFAYREGDERFPGGIVGYWIDITDRKKAEEELRVAHDSLELKVLERTDELQKSNEKLKLRNTELDEFTFIASHDLQEPLRKITAFGDLLKIDLGESINQKAAADLEYMTAAAVRMRLLINDLLTLSRAGRNNIEKRRISMAECAKAAIENLDLLIREKNAEIELENLPDMVGDKTLIIQLYQNLISNAVKFNGEKQPKVRLTYQLTDGLPVFGVVDNGIGIDPKYSTKIFAPFTRLHGKAEYDGTGIGLAICRKAVERHGGRIWIESQLGRGSHFCFTLGEAPVAKYGETPKMETTEVL